MKKNIFGGSKMQNRKKRFLALEFSFLKFRQKEKNRHLICKISDSTSYFRKFITTFYMTSNFKRGVRQIFFFQNEIPHNLYSRKILEFRCGLLGGGGITAMLPSSRNLRTAIFDCMTYKIVFAAFERSGLKLSYM